MGNSNRHDDAARAEVEEEAAREQQRLQEEQMNQLRNAMDQERRDRAERRREEREKQEAEEKRSDEKMEKIMEDNRKRKEADRVQEATRMAQQDAQLRETLENGSAALDRQREMNTGEVIRSATDHQNIIRREAEARQKAEDKAAERVIGLTKEKAETQEKLFGEQAQYTDRQLTETKQHHSRIEALEEKKTEILIERNQNQLQHQENLMIKKQTFAAQQLQLPVAGEKDRKELNFVDTVHNVRDAQGNLDKSISGLAKFTTNVEYKLPLSPKVINSCKVSRGRAAEALEVLRNCAEQVLQTSESNNPAVPKCQKTAREIQEIVVTLQPLLEGVEGFLIDGLTDEQTKNAVNLIKRILEEHKKLFHLVNDMPVVQHTNYTVTTIVQHVEAIANGNRVVVDVENIAIEAQEDGVNGDVIVEEAEDSDDEKTDGGESQSEAQEGGEKRK